ncbi:peptidoglycan-binding protein [Streptomyces sp. NPDC088794]|uniref:peptidoglycan-binding protein n=1 Tax=Streptomyces sp. NPDC088794 TaxID=3365902 RepID=UPI00381F67C0
MPTPPGSGSPDDRPPLEPVRVLRPRRTDALAQLLKDIRQDKDYRDREAVAVRDPYAWTDEETEELPPVADEFTTGTAARPAAGPAARSAAGPAAVPPRPPRAVGRLGFGPGHRRAAVVIGVGAAAVVGFGCALLLPGRTDAATASPPATASAAPTPAASDPGTGDPDGAGTLREGDSGPAVTDLQERLLHIPDVYEDGSTSGSYDTTLTEAVARFQLWYGIRGDETGVYGNDTRQALESRTAPGTG